MPKAYIKKLDIEVINLLVNDVEEYEKKWKKSLKIKNRMKTKDQIQDYDKKYKILKENNWTDLWHDDNWVREEYFGHPTIDVDRAGCSMDAAYSSVIKQLNIDNNE